MLTGFTAGLLLITVSELGDKTFFIAMVLAMRHPKQLVFSGVMSALAAMTVLSVLLGQLTNLFPKDYVRYAEVGLLALFGFLLLWQASKMTAKACITELEETELELSRNKLKWLNSGGRLGIVLQSFVLTFLGEWGDRTQFATITLAAGHHPLGVTMGAILGHGICAVIAVTSGCLLANYISEKLLTFIGGGLFLLFAIVAWFGA